MGQISTYSLSQIGLLLGLTVGIGACGLPEAFNQFSQEADNQFGDQHFKTAITLIELHYVRYGDYPQSLADLKYTGDWDQLAIQSVSYQKADKGYILNLERGWVGKADLEYPPDFWQNLGIIESNVKGQPTPTKIPKK